MGCRIRTSMPTEWKRLRTARTSTRPRPGHVAGITVQRQIMHPVVAGSAAVLGLGAACCWLPQRSSCSVARVAEVVYRHIGSVGPESLPRSTVRRADDYVWVGDFWVSPDRPAWHLDSKGQLRITTTGPSWVASRGRPILCSSGNLKKALQHQPPSSILSCHTTRLSASGV